MNMRHKRPRRGPLRPPSMRNVSFARRALRYVGAAPWPHATGAASALTGALLAFPAWSRLLREEYATACLFVFPCLGWLALAALCEADALSRYREYLRIRDLFVRRGYSERVLRLTAGSRCQRDAALFAARETGHGDAAKAFYHALGYRRRHLLPDKIVSNPLHFFHPRFLRATFLPGKSRLRDPASLQEPVVCNG